MPLASLPMLIAASPALVAMLLIPLVGSAPKAMVAQTAAYISYQTAEPRSTAEQRIERSARRPAAASRLFALIRLAVARAAEPARSESRASAFFSLFLPFPNAPRAP